MAYDLDEARLLRDLVEQGTLVGAVLSSSTVRNAILYAQVREVEFGPGGLVLVGCRMRDHLNIDNLDLAFGLSFLNCSINVLRARRLILPHLILDESRAIEIDLTEAHVRRKLSATGLEVDRIIAREAYLGSAILSGASVGSERDIDDLHSVLDLEGTVIEGGLDLSRAVVHGHISLESADIRGEIKKGGSKLVDPESAEELEWHESLRRKRPSAESPSTHAQVWFDEANSIILADRPYYQRSLGLGLDSLTLLLGFGLLVVPDLYLSLPNSTGVLNWGQVIAMAVLLGVGIWASFELLVRCGLRAIFQFLVVRLSVRLHAGLLPAGAYWLPPNRLVGQLSAVLRGQVEPGELDRWLDRTLIDLTALWVRVQTICVLVLAGTLTFAAVASATFATGGWWPVGVVVAVTASALAWALIDLRARFRAPSE